MGAPEQEQFSAEIVNDTDGGSQVTNVTVNLIFPMFCWFWFPWLPFMGMKNGK